MNTITIPKKEYQNILQRQAFIEKELSLLKKNFIDFDEKNIKPSALRHWEHISRDLDKGNGHSFSSLKEMKEWLNSF